MYEELLTETVTYFPRDIPDGTGGWLFGDPVQILVRWEDRTTRVQSEDGTIILSKARIYYSGTPPLHEGYLYRGTTAETDPLDLPGARRILSLFTSSSPDFSLTVSGANLE